MKPTLSLLTALLTPLVALCAADAPPKSAPEPITNSIGMKLMPIAPGSFQMGQDGPQTDYHMKKHPEESDRADWDEKPVHQVKISKPFHIGATEVTVEQYRQFDPEYHKGRKIGLVAWHRTFTSILKIHTASEEPAAAVKKCVLRVLTLIPELVFFILMPFPLPVRLLLGESFDQARMEQKPITYFPKTR